MDIQEKIDAYVKNRMSPDERTAFEAELRLDAGLSAAVEQARIDLDVANRIVEQELQGWMREWRKETKQPKDSVWPMRLPARLYWILAALALVVIWFVFRPANTHKASPAIMKPENSPTRPYTDSSHSTPKAPIAGPSPLPRPDDTRYVALAEKRFQGRTPRSFLRGTPESQPPDGSDALAQAIETWEKGDADRAAEIAATVPPTDEYYADALVLLGQIRFSQKQFARAERAFRTALATGVIGTDEAEWNILLCLLAQQPQKKAEFDLLLQKIADDGDEHTYKTAAKQLREEMEQGR